MAIDELERELSVITQHELAQLMGGNGYASSGLTGESSIEDVVNYFTGMGFEFTQDSSGNYFLGGAIQIQEVSVMGYTTPSGYDDGGSGDMYMSTGFNGFALSYLNLFQNHGYYPPGYEGGGSNSNSTSGYNPTPYDCFILCFREIYQQKFGSSDFLGYNNSYIYNTVQHHSPGTGGMPYPINEYGVTLGAAYNSLHASFDNVSKILSVGDLTPSSVNSNSVILAVQWASTGMGHALVLKSVYYESGVKKYEIYDPQDPSVSGHYTEDYFMTSFNFAEAYVIGAQDNHNQFMYNQGLYSGGY